MSSSKEKALLAIGTTAGLAVTTWRTMFPWIGYDLQLLRVLGKAGKAIQAEMDSNKRLIDHFEATVKRIPKKTYIIYEDRCYSYEFVNEQACRVANIVSGLGVQKGDTIAIFMHNSPEYIWTFWGLRKLGVIVTLLNIHSREEALLNSIKITDNKVVIVGQGDDLLHSINSVKDRIGIPIYVMGIPTTVSHDQCQSWDQLMLMSSPAEVCSSARDGQDIYTTCCYVFTSGTTGLPKAALMVNGKMSTYSKIVTSLNMTFSDVIYNILPFYHLSGYLPWLAAPNVGCTVLIRKKFSAGHFLNDCRKYNVTCFQYIGEMCRYLLALPEDSKDGSHNIRMMFGNGLRKDIWTTFQERFKIRQIFEFFGASEGTTFMANVSNRPGAIGRISPLLNKRDPAPKFLVKYDLVTAEPLRNEFGRCMKVKIGEPGLLITGIPPLCKDGFYKGDKEMSEKKIVRDVFQRGDAYFNFGDLMYLDKDYFVFFHDRIGDTFRWKGENVSTTEVANIMTSLSFIVDVNVYGVPVPGHDGKAGIASITLVKDKQPTPDNMKEIYIHCKKNLPKYARPLVLRIEKDTRMTSTFKQHKIDLVKEAFDPNLVSDPLFYMSSQAETYIPLNRENYHNLFQSKL